MGNFVKIWGAFTLSVFICTNLVCSVEYSRGERPKVQFFSEEDFQELVWESELDQVKETECINLPEEALEQDVKSIKTGECIMLYNTPDCQKPFGNKKYSIYSKILEENQTNFTFSETRKIASFHMCNDDQGANVKVNVDFYDDKGAIFPNADFKDVCTCKNLPESMKSARSSEMDNHGNCIRIYCGQDCLGTSKDIPPGFNYHSQILRIAGTLDKRGCNRPSSFQPCEATECSRLHATVYKVEFRNSTATANLEFENVELNTKMEFKNPSATAMIKEFEVEENLEESVEYSVADGLTMLHSLDADETLEFDSEDRVPVVDCKRFQGKLKHNFNYQKRRVQAKNRVTRVSQSREVEIEHKIDVPACSEVSVSAVVKMVMNFPIEYTAWARVSGENQGEQMTAQEIRSRLSEGKMVYLKDSSEDSVDVKFTGNMRAFYAQSSEVVIEGKRILKCLEENENVSVDEEELHQVVQKVIYD